MTTEFYAWHFLSSSGRLANSDGRTPKVGEKITVDPPLVICQHGLHWSRRAIDALKYAPGSVVCRVLASGDTQEQEDKGCSTERTIIAMADASMVLREFACDVAEKSLTAERDAGREPDLRSWDAIETTRKWMRGEVGEAAWATAEEAAWAAAEAAAGAAAEAAAEAAAGAAAEAAAEAAAWAAAWAAAVAAAWAAAEAAAEAAAWEEFDLMLTNALNNLLGITEDSE